MNKVRYKMRNIGRKKVENKKMLGRKAGESCKKIYFT